MTFPGFMSEHFRNIFKGRTDSNKASDPDGSSQPILYKCKITNQARLIVQLGLHVYSIQYFADTA